jgi:tetratricopeptide (TPR) repeat protein
MRRLIVVAAGLAVMAAACAGNSGSVARVVDGRTIVGREIPAEAYALFLRGAIAEASGQLDEAIAAYEAVRRWDDDDPEIFARIASARCTKDPADVAARSALARAFALDPAYGPALEARAKCGGGADDLARAAVAEPRWLPLQLAAASARRDDPRVGDDLLALTTRFSTQPAAWEALATWAFGHGARALGVHAAVELARLSPARSGVLHRFALALAGDGALTEARRVAAAAVDARADAARGGAPVPPPLVARLAVDEALARGDASTALRRASSGRLTPAEIASRALLLGARSAAEEIATTVHGADPADAEASLVLAALAPGPGTGLPPVGAATVSAAGHAAYVRALVVRDGVATARAGAAVVRAAAGVAGDGLVVRVQADLAARDVLAEAALMPEARIELAARRGAVPSVDPATVDRRHALLAAALRGEEVPRGASPDPLVTAAQLISLARRNVAPTDDERARAEALATDDALLTAALVTVAPPEKKPALRARLRVLAATDVERSLARE